MPYVVDFENVSTAGLESSPVATALAGLGGHPGPPGVRLKRGHRRIQCWRWPMDDSTSWVHLLVRISLDWRTLLAVCALVRLLRKR